MHVVKHIAVIPGDGVGPEVTAQAVRVLAAAAAKHHLSLELETLDLGAEHYLRDGTTLPSGELRRLRTTKDAILFGAIGDPRIADPRYAKEILLALRFELDLYINLRPVKCLDARCCPLKRCEPSDIDFVVFRENTEGPYVSVGGVLRRGTADEVSINEDINTRKGVERIVRAAFDYAATHGNCKVTMADKANAMPHAHDLWQRVFREVGADYPGVARQHLFVDTLALHLVKDPAQFKVIVTNNLFGDIISDLGAALQGGVGMAPSANLHPGQVSLFEPVHGSAPDLAGKGIANPIGSILSVALMLRHLEAPQAADDVEAAVARLFPANLLPVEVGGTATTAAIGDFVTACV